MKTLDLKEVLASEFATVNLLREIGSNILHELSQHYKEYMCKLRYVHTDEKYVHLIMDLAAANLVDIYKHLPGNVMTESVVCQYVDRLAHGVDAMHTHNVVHRDLKLGNILIGMTEPHYPLIADMGLAKQVGQKGRTHSVFFGKDDSIAANHYYMPPEIAANVCGETRGLF